MKLWCRNVGSCHHLRGLTNRYLSVTVSSWLAKMVIRLFNDLHLLEIYEAVKSEWDARLVWLVRTDCWLAVVLLWGSAASLPPSLHTWEDDMVPRPSHSYIAWCSQTRHRSPGDLLQPVMAEVKPPAWRLQSQSEGDKLPVSWSELPLEIFPVRSDFL